MKKEVRSLGRELRVVTDDAGQKTLTGYAVVYNSRSVDLGGFQEVVDPAAFTRTLRESPDVYALYAHASPFVVGRTKSGTLSLASDEHGLRFTCTPPDTSVARDMLTLIERGDVDGCSFGFMTRRDRWEDEPAGTVLRTLLDVDLDEISITPFPAYPETSVSLRSAPREIRARLTKRDAADGDGQCDCDCGPCMAGDCGGCDDADCADPNCRCADMRAARAKAAGDATRSQMDMQVRLARARMK